MVNSEGHSRVKPSELLRPAAQATSSKPATHRKIQDMKQLHWSDGAVPVCEKRKAVLTVRNYNDPLAIALRGARRHAQATPTSR
jgi:hypothetical protein